MRTRLALIVVFVLLAVPCRAEVRTILEVPINFQNDTTQPRTLAQLKADGDNGPAKVLRDNSYGTVTATTTVYDYVTVAMDKGCNSPGASLPALNMAEFYQKLDAALAARGQSRFGYTYSYIVSPTTFTKCSHTDRYGLNFHDPLNGDIVLTMFAWHLGLPMALNWACKTAVGVVTTLGPLCGPSTSTASGRTFTSISGQGGGSFTASERQQLGWLPAAQQTTVASTTTSGQWTLTYLENPAAGTKRLLIPSMGVELEYHAPKTSLGWDNRGVTAHARGTSNRLDFTPADNFDRLGSTALEPGASWVYTACPVAATGSVFPCTVTPALRLTVLSADLDAAVVDLRLATNPPPTLPAGPQCATATTSPDPSVNVTKLIDGTCGVWSIGVLRRAFRNPGGFYVGTTDSFSFCHGVVYVPRDGGGWQRYVTGTSGGSIMLPMEAPAAPVCSAAGAPPVACPANVQVRSLMTAVSCPLNVQVKAL